MKPNGNRIWAELQEIGIAGLIALVCSIFVPVAFFENVDEMLINCISIVIGASIAGISLTATAARPRATGVKSARELGNGLKKQVQFWFANMKMGGLALLALVVSAGLNWKLNIPRPEFVPEWIPDSNFWLILTSTFFVVLQLLRVPHITRAVESLIDLSTKAQEEAVLEHTREMHDRVAAEIAAQTPESIRPLKRQRVHN